MDGRAARLLLIELSAIPARAINEVRPRMLYRQRRIDTLRLGLSDTVRFVVFYSDSKEYVDAWTAIAGTALWSGRPVLIDATAFAVMPHPQRERAKEPWLALGQRLRELAPL